MAARSTSSRSACGSAAEPSLEQAEELAGMFHLLGDVNRLRLICACMDQAVCVQDLADRFGLSPSLVSHNLRLLKAARLMRAQRRGKQVFYTVDDHHVRTVLRDMTTHVAEPESDAD
ncbi:MAG: metalloregulator ArsR/SmtB family transcription factor [Gammaproteobacteria bacterium]|jgi:ArsR family transcriptional regulator, lead/cadmium/zinc/bismuth-responsive transcriptional repressor